MIKGASETNGRVDAAVDLVPFGKYRGRPVAEMVSDASYCEWISAQPWFRERYGNVYNLIVNYRGEPQDTPEHNQMQARFLETSTRYQVVRELIQDGLDAAENTEHGCRSKSENLNIIIPSQYRYGIGDPVFEQFGWDVTYTVTAKREPKWRDEDVLKTCTCRCNMTRCGGYHAAKDGLEHEWSYCYYAPGSYTRTDQRHKHCLKTCPRNWTLPEITYSASFALELKPSIADDYPTILRKVVERRQKGAAAGRYGGFWADHYLVVTGKVASTVVTEDQVRAMFASQKVGLVILESAA